PTGLVSMTEHILAAWPIDIAARTNPEGNQRGNSEGWKADAHEIKSGVIYKDAKVTGTAFPTKHARESYGYRFDTPWRTAIRRQYGCCPILSLILRERRLCKTPGHQPKHLNNQLQRGRMTRRHWSH